MTKKKYSLKFVKDGKPFMMPKWTVTKHKAALQEMNSECKDLSNEEKSNEFTYYVILQTLRQIDSSVTIDDIKELHPEDTLLLFNDVYNAGKEGIYFREPKKGNKKKGKKSTGKKK